MPIFSYTSILVVTDSRLPPLPVGRTASHKDMRYQTGHARAKLTPTGVSSSEKARFCSGLRLILD